MNKAINKADKTIKLPYAIKRWLYSGIVTIVFLLLAFMLIGISMIIKNLSNRIYDNATTRTMTNLNSYSITRKTTSSIEKQETNQTKEISESTTQYARIKQNCWLFRTNNLGNTELSNIYFTLPQTYFVEILSTDKTKDIANVKYNSIIGFCNYSKLEPTDWNPTMPYFESTLKVKPENSTQLWKVPSATETSNITKLIQAGTENIQYVASITSDVPADGTSDVWYFCIYNESDTILHIGYVYSERVILNTGFKENNETDPNLAVASTSTSVKMEENEYETTAEFEITKQTKIVLIIVFMIPTLAIFILLIKKPKAKRNEEILNKNKAKLDTDNEQNMKQIQKPNRKSIIDKFFTNSEPPEFKFPADDEPL